MISGLVYCLLGVFFILERALRKGDAALSLKPTETDAGSSRLLWINRLISLLTIFLAPLLNFYGIAKLDWPTIAWCGIGLMIAGLCLRAWAAREMGEFYTRTLQVLPEHRIIDTGPYRFIRHPGYLGTSLLGLGTGIALQNGLVLAIVIVTDMVAKSYRIRVEEKMLSETLGDAYQAYIQRTGALISFI